MSKSLKIGKLIHQTPVAKRYALNSLWLMVGFLLSPLSWWNDLVVNIPLAYLFSAPFTFIHPQWFLPSFVVGYWLSNLLGFILLHKGAVGLASQRPRKLRVWRYVVIALFYTFIIVIMGWLGWIPMPTDLMAMIKQ